MKGTPKLFFPLFLVTFTAMSFFHSPGPGGLLSPFFGFGDFAGEKEKVRGRRDFKWIEPGGRSLEIHFVLPEEFLNEAFKSFGVPSAHSKNASILLRRGFRLVNLRQRIEPFSGKIVEHLQLRIDYENVFRTFRKRMAEYAESLYSVAFDEKGLDPLRQFLSFVQQIPYRQPPEVYKGRFINGFFVPPICLAEGYGDCDSKAILLADLLSVKHEREEKLGLALIEGRGIAHVVLLVQRPQLPGMSSIFAYGFGRYLPVETTAPGWNPGFISPVLVELLKDGDFSFVPLALK